MQIKRKRKSSSLSILSIAGVKPYEIKDNEKYMNTTQINHFKKILNAWKQQLTNKITQNLNYSQNTTINYPDPIDRAVQEEEFSLNLRNRDRECKLIHKIEQTLNKIKKNNFGYCTTCGIEIGIKRLEARPTANLCIDCKTLSEIRAKQMTY
ncbi:poly(A) polymerase I [Buchnera aphidicola (Nipponaphis monzeni)]|uniref:RNA polymerase-binding transcription factor DksA n=1 Tax=Buchnera aphidicola (Nipponaphis monzeni) TaxID=2495405 RepID=A0A455TA11_9GAMM|nr:RNA polymerase-binding protein DksA [Buchnera aphidicola]BBI01176.1 poly(A) polymerase I [Buchnera aphidicola (Nipponaphis monzeni)]